MSGTTWAALFRQAADLLDDVAEPSPPPEPPPAMAALELLGGWYGDGHRLQAFMPVLPVQPVLPTTTIAYLATVFTTAREEGAQLIFRPRYNKDGSGVDAPLTTIFDHILQIGPLLREFADVLFVYQAGWVGRYGEFHGSANPNNEIPESRNAIVLSMLASTEGVPVAVRRPEWHRAAVEAIGAPEPRLTVYDDCIGCSDTDGGSWASGTEDDWRDYIGSLVGPVGGELSQMSGTADELRGYENTLRICRQMDVRYLHIGWNRAVWADWTLSQMAEFTEGLVFGWR